MTSNDEEGVNQSEGNPLDDGEKQLRNTRTYAFFTILPVIYVPSPIQPLSTNPPKTTATIKVLLVGDSMWGIPSRRMNIVGKIRAYLPQYSMNISVSGKLGVKMADLRHRIRRIMRIVQPDLSILYCEADLSNVNEEPMTPLQKLQTRVQYRQNLLNVTAEVLRAHSKLAIAGPGIMGEQVFKPLRSYLDKYSNKDRMVDEYRWMNQQVAAKFNLPYVDTRLALLSAVPWWRLYFNGYVTADGEHPNERGAVLTAKLFAQVLLDWVEGFNSTEIARLGPHWTATRTDLDDRTP